ncbi:MAG TPA: hypothetical protein DCY07_01585 [Rhodospirillaceae bacterium]|nr:hypothetical protein [Rhodospirillaceae bacterium]
MMETPPLPTQWKIERPETIRHAVWMLAGWTGWICLFGIYQAWVQYPAIQEMMAVQLQGMISIDFQTWMSVTVGTYVVLAASMAWILKKLFIGRNWTRYCIAFNLLITAAAPALSPAQSSVEYMALVPDLGLQAYAVYLLFSWPGRTWFNPPIIPQPSETGSL